MSLWLDTFFKTFDYKILAWFHLLAENHKTILTPLSLFFSFVGGLANLLIIISIIMLIINKNRKMALYIICSVCVSLIVCNLAIKLIVNRARPYETLELFRNWWQYAGGYAEIDSSFPSAHSSAAMAGISAAFMFSKNKKISWLLYIYPLCIAFSRGYLIAHYPSDILAGLMCGLICSFIAKFILDLFFNRFKDKLPIEIS